MGALLVTMTLAATIRKPEHLPGTDDWDTVQEAWESAVNDASERYKADHPEWFVC